ncbi:MAG: hypothetical protein M0Q44_03790, partial [Methylobacter sp.]|nr:hypothetical protein [Methylobacter sp.]
FLFFVFLDPFSTHSLFLGYFRLCVRFSVDTSGHWFTLICEYIRNVFPDLRFDNGASFGIERHSYFRLGSINPCTAARHIDLFPNKPVTFVVNSILKIK